MPYERLDENARKAGEEVGEIMPPFEQYTYPASMARAVADDLRASQRFARVDYVGNEPADGYHYILTGQVRASPIEKDLTSYGLGAAGVLLWFLPIPNGQIWASLTLDLVLTDSHSGREVWKVTLQPEMAQWTSLYTSSPTLVYGGVSSFDFPLVPSEGGVDRESLFSWHFELLRRAMADIPKQIAAATKD